MFDEQFENDKQDKQRCEDCEYKRLVHAGGGFLFNGCYHRPYIGKWVANIKDCPKEMESDLMMGMTVEQLIKKLEKCNKKDIVTVSNNNLWINGTYIATGIETYDDEVNICTDYKKRLGEELCY